MWNIIFNSFIFVIALITLAASKVSWITSWMLLLNSVMTEVPVIETSPFIWKPSQWTSLYIIRTSVMKELSLCQHTYLFLALCITFLNHLYALVDKLYVRLLANVIFITAKPSFLFFRSGWIKLILLRLNFP